MHDILHHGFLGREEASRRSGEGVGLRLREGGAMSSKKDKAMGELKDFQKKKYNSE